jgi:alanyl-tRNA synthetase
MATRRLYYEDSYLQTFSARVLSCLPAEPFLSAAGTVPSWEVLLDQSAFYPASGGQPNDLGLIAEANVLDVRDDESEILHIVDRELAPGPIQACVSWPRRFDHMQQHTGQHLLSAVFHERFGLPTVSFHLGSYICTIDLRGPEPGTEVLLGAQRAANAIIFENRPIHVRFATASQLATLGVRKEVAREGILRAIEIEGADLQPCGGTHVNSTGQIGLILARRFMKVRQDWRVEFVCGRRADQFASDDFALLRQLAGRLTCSPDEILAAVDKVFVERESNYKSSRAVLQQLAEARASLLVSATPVTSQGPRIIAELVGDLPSDYLQLLATEIAKRDATLALLVQESTGQLVFAQHPVLGRDLPAVLKELLAKFPGKGGGTRNFVRAKLVDPAFSAAALTLVRSLVST